jgi:uncharacterized Zn-finger protein
MEFSCQWKNCEFKTTFENNYIRHIYTHEYQTTKVKPTFIKDTLPKYSCTYDPQCNYTCKWNSDLVKHNYIHTGIIPYVCPMEGCFYETARKDKYAVHKRIHTKQLPYICNFQDCTEKFICRRLLNKHIRKHNGETKFKCHFDGCRWGGEKSNAYKKHLLVRHDYIKEKIDNINL